MRLLQVRHGPGHDVVAWTRKSNHRASLGAAEILAAAGITLPGLTRIQPWLVTWAAGGIMIVMVSATIWHIARGENGSAAVTFVLLVMATFVADGRRRLLPIRARARRHE